jgi:hypothetical protein
MVFYGLLALFPAITALVSSYALFAKASTINDHLSLLAGVLPGGAFDIVKDQVNRAGQGRGEARLCVQGQFPAGGLERQWRHESHHRCSQRGLRRTGEARIFSD